MSANNKDTKIRDVVVFTAEELSAVKSKEQAVRQKINALQLKPGDKLIVREYSHNGNMDARQEYIGKLLREDDSMLEILTCGKKVWSNEKNKRSVPYRDIEDIMVLNKA